MSPFKAETNRRFGGEAHARSDVRRGGLQGLRREIALLLAIKALALALIWYLFFSPAHRLPVDGDVTGQRFGLAASSNVQAGAAASRPMERTHD